MALATAALALLVSLVLFPHFSPIVDEPVYVLQARTLLDGHLTLSADHTGPFQPLFTAVHGDRVVFKYPPVWPAVLAASQLVFGTMRAALVLVAAGTVAAFAALAREVLPGRRAQVVATLVFASSPLLVVQAATFLSYLFSLLLSLVFAVGLLRGVRFGRAGPLAAAGLALGLGLFARPFDTLLFCVPVTAFVAWEHRNDRPGLLRAAVVVALAALPIVVTSLAFNRHVTGELLKPPFLVTDELDTLSFGPRRVYPDAPTIAFGLRQGIEGLWATTKALGRWCVGGPLLALFAVWGVARQRRRPVTWLLVALGVAFPLGYVFFWGAYNLTIVEGAVDAVGPFYYLPALVPLALLAAVPLAELSRRPAGLVGAVALVLVVATAVLLRRPLTTNLEFTRGWDGAYRLVDEAHLEAVPGGAAVLLEPQEGPFLLQTFRRLGNPSGLSGPVVYAVDRGPGTVETVHRRQPGRTLYRLSSTTRDGEEHRDYRLEPLAPPPASPRP